MEKDIIMTIIDKFSSKSISKLKLKTEEFSIEYGLQFLEDEYQFSTRFDNKNLKQREVQLLRNVNMIQDYKLYGVLTVNQHFI